MAESLTIEQCLAVKRHCVNCVWWAERGFCFCPKEDARGVTAAACPYFQLRLPDQRPGHHHHGHNRRNYYPDGRKSGQKRPYY